MPFGKAGRKSAQKTLVKKQTRWVDLVFEPKCEVTANLSNSRFFIEWIFELGIFKEEKQILQKQLSR